MVTYWFGFLVAVLMTIINSSLHLYLLFFKFLSKDRAISGSSSTIRILPLYTFDGEEDDKDGDEDDNDAFADDSTSFFIPCTSYKPYLF